jgi:hypothetical protein
MALYVDFVKSNSITTLVGSLMPLVFRFSALIMVAFLSHLSLLAQSRPASPLLLKTSDSELQQTFDWAKAQALSYVGPAGDAVGDWYEAALPGRHAFCMRDVSHQTMGAFALGLASQNHNMLRHFAESISDSKDWASYWEIDRDGKPSSADYESDDDFWYNLPANFDVMSAALRMYQWTGDTSYVDDPVFTSFYHHTLTDYPKKWSLEPPALLTRKRIMNRHASSGKFVEARGIPSYTEGHRDFVLGVDLLAAEFRSFRLAADLAQSHEQTKTAQKYELRARELQQIIETKAWDSEKHQFYGFMGSDQRFFGEGNTFILYFSAVQDPDKARRALAAIKGKIGPSAPNIEEQSYFPEILYKYGAAEAAYDQIRDLSRVDRDRRDYPEVSYSIIGAIVTGMMGVDVASPLQTKPSHKSDVRTVVRTRSQLSSRSRWVELDRLPVGDNVIDIRHDGGSSSTLTNVSGRALLWRPSFQGRSGLLLVNGKKVEASVATDGQHRVVTTASIVVAPNSRATVKMLGAKR